MDCCLQSLVKLQKPFKYIGKFLATPLVKIILLEHSLKVSNECVQKMLSTNFNIKEINPILLMSAISDVIPISVCFLVTCVVVQKNGAGVHTSSSCFWDNSTDGSCTVRWENKTMYCIVSVFGLAI